MSTSRPIDFVYNRRTDTFDLTPYRSDRELIAKIQTGKGDPFVYYTDYRNLFVEIIFAGTIPNEPK